MSLARFTRLIPRNQFHTTAFLQAGHSKWANIRHDKAKNDAKKSKDAYFIASRITSSVKAGGVDGNAQLVTLMDKAKKMNVTKKIIDNAIKRGTGELGTDGAVLSPLMYEFMGPNGTAFIIEAQTDNKNRTIGLVKNAMARFSAKLSSCQYMFQRKGEIVFDPLLPEQEVDDVLEVAIDIGAEDVEEYNDLDNEYEGAKLFRILTDPSLLNDVSNELAAKGYKLRDSKTIFQADPDSMVDFPEEQEKAHAKMEELLDEINEVTNYYSNIRY